MYKVILYGDLFTIYSHIIEKIDNFTDRIDGYKSKSNTLLFPSSSTNLKDFFPCSSLNETNVMIGSDLSIFEINNTNDANFFSYLFSNYTYSKNLFRLTEGSTINHLYGNYIYQFKIFIPKLNEQQKIAHFFSLLDKQIQLWERKLELTELLFNKKLNLIFSYKKIKQSTVILKDVIKIETLKNKEKLNLTIGTISNKLGLIEQTTYFDGYTLASEDLSNYYILKENWFAYNPARINVGSITVNNKKKIYLISPMYIIFSCKNEKLTKSIFYYTKSHCFNQFIKSKISGTVRNTLNSEANINYLL